MGVVPQALAASDEPRPARGVSAMKWAAALVVLAAFGCGGGSDGQPVTPPPSAPPPEPPGSAEPSPCGDERDPLAQLMLCGQPVLVAQWNTRPGVGGSTWRGSVPAPRARARPGAMGERDSGRKSSVRGFVEEGARSSPLASSTDVRPRIQVKRRGNGPLDQPLDAEVFSAEPGPCSDSAIEPSSTARFLCASGKPPPFAST